MTIADYSNHLSTAREAEQEALAVAAQAVLVAAEAQAWREYVESWDVTLRAEEFARKSPDNIIGRLLVTAARHTEERLSEAWSKVYMALHP